MKPRRAIPSLFTTSVHYRARGDPGRVSSQCRGIAATEIAGRSWDTGREPRDIEEGKRHHPTRKPHGRRSGTSTFCPLALSLRPSSVSLFTYHRDTESGQHESKQLSRTQGSEKATARVGSSMASSIPTTGTKSPRLFCHLAGALPPDGQRCLTCPTHSPAAGPPKRMSFPSLRTKEEEEFRSPKPHMGTRFLFAWEAQRKTARDRQTERSARLGCATHSFTSFLALLCTN